MVTEPGKSGKQLLTDGPKFGIRSSLTERRSVNVPESVDTCRRVARVFTHLASIRWYFFGWTMFLPAQILGTILMFLVASQMFHVGWRLGRGNDRWVVWALGFTALVVAALFWVPGCTHASGPGYEPWIHAD